MGDAYFGSRSPRIFLAFCGVLFLISACAVGGWGIHVIISDGPAFDIILATCMTILFLATGVGCLLLPRRCLATAHRRQQLVEEQGVMRPEFEMSLFWPIALGSMFTVGVVLMANDTGPHPPGASLMGNVLTWMVRIVAALAWIGLVHGLLIRFHFRHWGLRLDASRVTLGQWGGFELLSDRPLRARTVASIRLSGAQWQDSGDGTCESRRHPVNGTIDVEPMESGDRTTVHGRFRVDSLKSRGDDAFETEFRVFLFVRDGWGRVCVFPLPIDPAGDAAVDVSRQKVTTRD